MCDSCPWEDQKPGLLPSAGLGDGAPVKQGLRRKLWAQVIIKVITRKELLEIGSRKCHEAYLTQGLGLGR